MASKRNEIVNTHCNDCIKNTNHVVLFKKEFTTFNDFYPENSPSYKESESYMVVQCAGCEQPSFLLRTIGTQFATEDEEIGHFDENFPDRYYDTDFPLLSEEEQLRLPTLLRNLYGEVEAAFESESNILAGVGLRMLVEGICLERKIAGKNLLEKIKNLHSANLLSANEVPILDKLRQIGNFSAHSIKGFSTKDLQYALEIINHVLKTIYILPLINKRLKI